MTATQRFHHAIAPIALVSALTLTFAIWGPATQAGAAQESSIVLDEAASSSSSAAISIAFDATSSSLDVYNEALQEQQEQAAAEAAEQAKEEEIASWASRIDSYLAGSPLEGYGETFARVALEQGVDPRLSPAIAEVESGKGSVCYASHNAWGWGGISWSDWETAIESHISGLAESYGSSMAEGDYGLTASMSMASSYCGVSASEWYQQVTSAMARI